MSPEIKEVRAGFVRCFSYLLGFVLLSMLLCPAARSSSSPGQTTLRGCLRAMGEHTFILIGENRLGYMLIGDRDVFSRHTDQEVQVAGTAAERTPDDGPSRSLLQAQLLASAKHKKAKPVITFPGLRNVQVSSLTPLAQQCSISSRAR